MLKPVSCRLRSERSESNPRLLFFVLCIFFMFAGYLPVPFASDRIPAAAGTWQRSAGLVWYEAALLGVEGQGWKAAASDYSRLPLKARGIVPDPVWNYSRCAAGLQVRFATDAAVLHVRWTLTRDELAMHHMPATGASGIDLYARDGDGRLRFAANGRPGDAVSECCFDLPASEEYLLYFPLYNGVKHVEIGIARDKALFRLPGPQRQIVFYGTSITQGACASRPGMAATAIVSRNLAAEVINLGFSGSALMEIEIAEFLSELDPAVYVLDCLVNMSPQQIAARTAPFVRRIRKSHPATPILLVEDANFRDRTTSKGTVLRQVYSDLKAQGDIHLHLLSNKGMLGTDGDGTVDGIHPNDLGMARQAAVFTAKLRSILVQTEAQQKIGR